MSFPKISKHSLSFSTENSENLPVKIISNNKMKTILNKSIGIGTNENDNKKNFTKRALITSLNNEKYFTEPNIHKFKYDYSMIPKYKTSRNSKLKLNFPGFKSNINSTFNKIPISNYKSAKGNILKNQIIKNQVTFIPKPSIKSNYISFQKRSKEIKDNIVFDDISLIGNLMNQTMSNFNNKYQIQYWTKNKRKKEEIKYCFNLIKRGKNLTEINDILNGPKEIISYEIQTNSDLDNHFFNQKYNMNGIKDRKNKYNITVNTLESIKPLTSFEYK